MSIRFSRLLLLLLFVAPVFGQGNQVPVPPVFDPSGRPIPGATISFCTNPGNALPCTNHAQAYSDQGLTKPINQTTNQIKSDQIGNSQNFYAAPGLYQFTISGPSIGVPHGPDVITVPCVPGNFCQGATRLFISGNSISPSDFAFSGWGTGATISSISGTDSRFQFTMMAGSSPCGRGCATVTLTFHDRPWNTIQTVTPTWIGGTGAATELATTNNLSSLTMTFKGTPVNGQPYTYSVIVSGQSAVSFSQLYVNPVVQNPVGPQTTGAKPLTVPGNLIANSLNGAVHLMDGVKYPFTRAGLQECINDAITSFGTCDASAVPSVTFNSQINVGNSSGQGVTLILPTAATWAFNITDGVSCGIRQYNKTAILSKASASGGSLFSLAPSSSAANMAGLFCTEDSPALGGVYVYAERILASNLVGATMAKGAVVLQHLFDNSTFVNITGINPNGVGVKIFDVCCGTSFYNLSADGVSGSGARPLVLGDTVLGGSVANGGLYDVYFSGLSVGHPGVGNFAMEIGDSTNTGTHNAFDENITFSGLYMEPNATNTTTQGIQIRPNVHSIVMNGCNFSNTARGSTAYFIDIAGWAGPSNSSFVNCKSQTGNVINDHVTGLAVFGASSYGHSPAYFSGGSIQDNLTIGAGSAVTSSGAGGTAMGTPNQATFSAAPTISSGFGTSPSIANNNGSLTFTINVGTGGTASSGVIGLSTAPHGWDVNCKDITTTSSTVFMTKQTATSTTTATVANFNTSGAAAAWAASDILSCTATPY